MKQEILEKGRRHSLRPTVMTQATVNGGLDENEADEFNFYGRRLLDIRLAIAADSRYLLDLREDEVTSLEGIADSATAWAKVRAQNWLNIYDGRSFPDVHAEVRIDTSGYQERQVELTNSITLFPNPVKDQLEIEYVNLNDKGAELEIVNVFGLVVSKTTLEDNYGHKTIDVNNWSSGFYFYNVKYQGLVFEKGKFFKQ